MIEAAVLILAVAALLAAAAVAGPRLFDLGLRVYFFRRPGAVRVRGWDGKYRTAEEHAAHERRFFAQHARPDDVGLALTPPLPRRRAS